MKAQKRLTPHSRIELIHPGAPISEIAQRSGSGAEIRARFQLEDRPTIGIIGRLERWKGQMLFLEAAAQVARVRRDARFLVVGGAVLGWKGTYPAELQRFADSRQELAGKVVFAGHQEDIFPWYDACDVVVHASDREPFGLVLLEAMALQRPLIATRGGGPSEIVEDGKSGLLVSPQDADAMAEAILRLIGDPILAAGLASGGRSRAEEFTGKRMAMRWAGLLDEVVDC